MLEICGQLHWVALVVDQSLEWQKLTEGLRRRVVAPGMRTQRVSRISKNWSSKYPLKDG